MAGSSTSDRKYCKFCETEHELTSEFWYRLDSYPSCKRRKLDKARQWSDLNKEAHLQMNRNYYQDNRDRVLDRTKQYNKQNRTSINIQRKGRYHSDLQFRLASILRSRTILALQGKVKAGSGVEDLGCSVEELKLYLESLWTEGMSWDNYSRLGWNIDHIRPISSFDLTDPAQFKQAVHYTNLQPMWATENFKKGNRLCHLTTSTNSA